MNRKKKVQARCMTYSIFIFLSAEYASKDCNMSYADTHIHSNDRKNHQVCQNRDPASELYMRTLMLLRNEDKLCLLYFLCPCTSRKPAMETSHSYGRIG